ncbi:RNA-dependent ATPase HCA4 [Sugiyamaella lignohabitans]|uniref:ATP-dependent RNA helicase n=1 Tax=Sugiyamaella lignohabitans TaxID=796027 RepID=A0A167EBP8_9ASCO|nr:RNA-dependent ATPase HCA4 [Sugiyamaella lignohabitans]ANB13878.1 RNA-dependent ATPase HCA4 [Sugiyamaella lignohabitans]
MSSNGHGKRDTNGSKHSVNGKKNAHNKNGGGANNNKSKHVKRQSENAHIAALETQIKEWDPAEHPNLTKFEQLPLSRATLQGLRSSHFVDMTDIQRQSLMASLKGEDILGAARTGSGKTLAFLIPVLERLYRQKWNQQDGLGALIISPTRELAIQIFQVLRKIGRAHSLSAGLVIGGKDVQVESERLARLNILIGTPGRLLQHLDQTAGFDVSNLQMLVLDEADRILDMGFKKSLDAIIDNLPTTRQTLLFSATQTKTVSDLARLSLSDPRYISVHEEDQTATPKGLEQFYIVSPLDEKLDNMYAFIKSHIKTKMLIFFSSSKQVRFAYESFRKLQPGIPLLHLHGKQKQQARIDVTQKFSSAQYSCLFATDIVARGIDFPAVDWVIQVDAPEDAATYIHRVGRSARFDKKGRALLFVTPSEEKGMISALESRKVPISKLTIREAKKKSIRQDLQALCFQDPELKYLGQKAFISYVRSVYIQKNKDIFNFESLPLEKFAESLGLPGAPNIKIKGGERSKEAKNAPRQLLKLTKEPGSDDEQEGEDKKKEPEKVRTKYDRMFERKNQNVLSEHYLNLTKTAGDEDDGDDFIAVKRQDHIIDDEEIPNLLEIPTSKRAQKRALSKKLSTKSKGNATKLVFDDEGNAHAIYELEDEEDFKKAGDAAVQKAEFVARESAAMQEKDIEDKQVARDKRVEKKRRRQEIERRALEAEQDESDDGEGGYQVTLGGADDESDYDHNQEPDIDRDYESSDNDEPAAKKPKWFQKDKDSAPVRNGVLEVEEPDTLEDLEALSARLIRGR